MKLSDWTYGTIVSFYVFWFLELGENGFGENFAELDTHLIYK